MMKMTIGAAVSLVLTALLLVTATAFDATYHKRLRDLRTKATQLEGDILDVQVQKDVLSGPAGSCLASLHHSLELVSDKIDFLSKLALLASSMNDKSDEQIVVRLLQFEAKNFLEVTQLHRNAVNSMVGGCSRYGAVTVKGQEIFGLHPVPKTPS